MHGQIGIRWPAESPERRKWQNPEAMLTDIGLKPGLTFIDLGCAGGFFTLPAARIVGQTGTVYGIDVDVRSIKSLEDEAARAGLRNIKVTAGRGEDMLACDRCADIVFFGTALHDFQDPAKVLQNARKIVKPSGNLVNLDWKEEAMPLGPPIEKRFSPEKAIHLIESAGFTFESVKDNGPYHYLIIARPNS